MPAVRLDTTTDGSAGELLRIESDLLRIELYPALGGKIYRWIHRPSGRDFLWQHPHVQPAIVPTGAGYDDCWSGGWDDLFPSDAPGHRCGMSYPDHGEFWTTPFEWAADRHGDSLTLRLSACGPVTRTRMERWITLTASSPVVQIRYRLTHIHERPFDYFWRLHPAMRVEPGHRLLIPASGGVIATPGLGRLSADDRAFIWPNVPGHDGRLHDFSRVPHGDVPEHEMLWLSPLREGWFAVVDPQARAGFGMAFDPGFFTNVWLFQSYGGWRGLRVAVIEPCTHDPYDRPAARATDRLGRASAQLRPGQTLETRIAVVAFTGRDEVRHIASDGVVS